MKHFWLKRASSSAAAAFSTIFMVAATDTDILLELATSAPMSEADIPTSVSVSVC